MSFLLVLIFSSCTKSPQDRLDHLNNGVPIVMSAFIMATFENNPVGRDSKSIISFYKHYPVLNRLSDSLFKGPWAIDKKLIGISNALDGRFGQYVRFYFLRDTCTNLFIEDSVLSSGHFDACVELIGNKFGKPAYDHYSPGMKSVEKVIDHYTWQKGNLKIEALRWGSYNGYYIDIMDIKRDAELQKIFSDSLPPQTL